MGYTPLQISAVRLPDAYLGNFNIVPLVALAIATPGWGLRERCEMLAIGHPAFVSSARAGPGGAFPDVFPWLRDCAVRSVFNRGWRRSTAVYYMGRIFL